ncbi:MAG TPA: hypothetical protein VLJ59_01870 [Mycobacteriales bacterium]|nr:hypothetical protein [Mycobacteriales bacterium]
MTADETTTPEPAQPPTPGELLATWQAWARRDTYTAALGRATAAGRGEDARVLRDALAQVPDVDPLAALAANRELTRLLTGQRWHAVRAARADGGTWGQVAAALGTTPDHARAELLADIEHAETYAPGHTDTTAYRAVLDDPTDETRSRS